jgi:hypothetical protein
MKKRILSAIIAAAGGLAAALQGVDAALLGLEVRDSLPELLTRLQGQDGEATGREAAFIVAALAEAPGPVPPTVLEAAAALRASLEAAAPDLLDVWRREGGRLGV